MSRALAHVFIATSLDGFIARADGAIDWLLRQQARVPEGEDCGYGGFIAGVQALVMGRHSFEQALRFDPWPYELPVVVLARRGLAVPPALQGRVSVSAEAPRALLERLGAAGVATVYVDGGVIVQAFLREGLVDEMTVTTVPVLLGGGRPLFGALPADVDVELVDSRCWPFGFVQNRWRVIGPSGGSDASP
jgi:dihydrofolate reductase